MKRTILGLLAAAAMVRAVPVSAHHSIAAAYYEDKTQSFEGNLIEFLFRNPHSFVYLDAPDEKGVMQHWAIEWISSFQLDRQGVTRETLHPGDHVIITGNQSRNPDDHRIRMRTISRPKDGWKWGGTFD